MPKTESELKEFKKCIREKVWSEMERKGIAAFPRPVYGRIPNFVGAEKAAVKLASMDIFRSASVVKVNPDAPQQKVRELALEQGKTVLMPTPRLKQGFILLDPKSIPLSKIRSASTIRGAFIYGKLVDIDSLPDVDLIVVGSVAVDRHGVRIGKGGGYAELEYGILGELGKVKDSTPIATTVHDVQLFNIDFPRMPYDLVMDVAVTPTRVVKFGDVHERPHGIYWELLEEDKIYSIPILKELAKRVKKAKHFT